MVALGARADGQHQQHGGDGAGEREQRDAERAESQQDGHCGAERRALRSSEDIGGDERVLERALVGGAGSSQAAAHHERERDARQTHLEEQRLLLGGPERVDGERQVGQHADSLDRGDGVAAQHERGQRARQDERAERD